VVFGAVVDPAPVVPVVAVPLVVEPEVVELVVLGAGGSLVLFAFQTEYATARTTTMTTAYQNCLAITFSRLRSDRSHKHTRPHDVLHRACLIAALSLAR
jgi:hypothetical protein